MRKKLLGSLVLALFIGPSTAGASSIWGDDNSWWSLVGLVRSLVGKVDISGLSHVTEGAKGSAEYVGPVDSVEPTADDGVIIDENGRTGS